jgi:hypothetical protein
VTIREVSKKLARLPKTAWPGRNGRFREKIKFEPVWPGDLPWWCYALNYGRYVEKGPFECRNVSFWLPFEQVIFC